MVSLFNNAEVVHVAENFRVTRQIGKDSVNAICWGIYSRRYDKPQSLHRLASPSFTFVFRRSNFDAS